MPRMSRSRTQAPERGATVRAYYHPDGRFFWMVQTGTAVDRQAIAAQCTNTYAIRAQAKLKALTMAQGRVTNPETFINDSTVAEFIKVTRRALSARVQYATQSGIPKGPERARAEAILIRAILESAAQAARNAAAGR